MGNKLENQRERIKNLSFQIEKMDSLSQKIKSLPEEIVGSINGEEKRHGGLKNLNLVEPDDIGRVDLLVNRFRENVNEFNYEGVVNTWVEMQQMVKERKESNSKKHDQGVITTESNKISNFTRIVKQNLPDVPIIEIGGLPGISTKKGGIPDFLVRLFKVGLMNIGNKKYRDVLDDKISMSPALFRLSNQFGSGDETVRFEESWENIGDLQMTYAPPEALDFINKLIADIAKKDDPLSPIGMLEVYQSSASQTDLKFVNKVDVVVSNPDQWMAVFNELKTLMKVKINTADNSLHEPIYLRHFWINGLKEIVDSRAFKTVLFDRLRIECERKKDEKWKMTKEMPELRPRWFGGKKK